METTAGDARVGIVLLAAVGAGFVARRVGLPAVVGYLLVGLLVSPFTPGYVADPEQLHLLADVGVVLLLFEVGIEVDLRTLRREQRALFWVAPNQMLVTTLIGGGVFLVLGFALIPAAILGLCVAFSSSVVVVNITRSRRRTTDLQTERSMLGWAVLQDVTGVVAAGVLLAHWRSVAAGDRLLAGPGGLRPAGVDRARVLPLLLAGLRHGHDLFLIASVASGLALAGVGAVVFGVPLALAPSWAPPSPKAPWRPKRAAACCRSATSSPCSSSSPSARSSIGDLLVRLPMLGVFWSSS